MQSPRLGQEEAVVGLDRRRAVKKVMQRGHVRAFGMAPLHWLVELLRIAEQNDAPRSLRNRQNIRKRHLRGFVDEQNVDRACRVGPRPEPRRCAGDRSSVADRVEERLIACYAADGRVFGFSICRLLNALQVDARLPGRDRHVLEKLANDLVTVGRHADLPPGGDKSRAPGGPWIGNTPPVIAGAIRQAASSAVSPCISMGWPPIRGGARMSKSRAAR